MRTTLTFDDDILEKLQRLATEQRVSFRSLVNDLLRRVLSGQEGQARPKPFAVETFRSAFRPGVDPLRLNQLIDDLEVAQARDQASRDRS